MEKECATLLPWPHPLEPALLVGRRKRFFADVERPPQTCETVHCANSGSMKSLLNPGCRVWTLDSRNPERKLRHTLELMEQSDGLACVNTLRANALAGNFLASALAKRDLGLPAEQASLLARDLDGVVAVRPEARFSTQTRFDFALLTDSAANSSPPGWLEVKSVSLRLDEHTVAFPDAVTERGQRHLQALMTARRLGQRAFLWFVVMRGSAIPALSLASSFRTAHEIDPAYDRLLNQAHAEGVAIRVVVTSLSLEGLGVRGYFEMALAR